MVRDGVALFSGGLRNVFSLADLKLERLLDSFDDWARDHGAAPTLDPPERHAPTRVPASARWQLDLRQRGDQHDRVGHRLPARLRLARRARGRREGPAAPRRGRGRQPRDCTPSACPVLRRRRSTFIHGIDDDARAVVEHLTGHLAGPARTWRSGAA